MLIFQKIWVVSVQKLFLGAGVGESLWKNRSFLLLNKNEFMKLERNMIIFDSFIAIANVESD